jgi:hypothetical protein
MWEGPGPANPMPSDRYAVGKYIPAAKNIHHPKAGTIAKT